MIVRKCDICKKTIKKRKGLSISPMESVFENFELCISCAEPVMRFLETKELIKKEKNKK